MVEDTSFVAGGLNQYSISNQFIIQVEEHLKMELLRVVSQQRWMERCEET